MLSCILALICATLVIAVDQISKYYISSNLILGEVHDFINGLINIVFVENRGAAWGMLSGKTWVLLGISVVAMLICVYFLIKYALKNKLLFWSLCLILAGGIGNMIDRFFNGGVVIDFLQFDFWQSFPVFNIADCSIVIGGALLILYVFIDTFKEIKQSKKETIADNEDN